jgi:hypothetical protein
MRRAPALRGGKMAVSKGKQAYKIRVLTTTKRVTHGDGTAVDVHFFERNADFVDGVDGLRCERLVDFEEIAIVLVETSVFEYFRYSVGWTDGHDSGRDTDDCRGDVFANDRETQFLGR